MVSAPDDIVQKKPYASEYIEVENEARSKIWVVATIKPTIQ